MSTNPLRGETVATIGGIERRLRLGADELIRLQEHLGRGPIALLAAGAIDFKESVVVLHYAMKGAGRAATIAEDIALLNGTPALALLDAANRALAAGLGLNIPADAGNAPAPRENS